MSFGYPHGSYQRYRSQRCRCDECKKAAKAYWERVRARLPELPPGDVRHGSRGAYANFGCRCEKCKRGQRTRYAEAKRKREAS